MYGLIPQPLLRRLRLLTIGRVIANGLDIVALGLVYFFISAALGVSDSSIYKSTLPILGSIEIGEGTLVLGLLLIAVLFILKSALSINLRRITARTVAKVEVKFAKTLSEDFMSYGYDRGQSGLSELQNKLSLSVQGLGLYLNSKYTAVAEGSLLFVLITLLAVVNPLLTIVVFFYLGAIALVLGKLVRGLIASNSLQISNGNSGLLDSIKDIYGSKVEIGLRGSESYWLGKVFDARQSVSFATASNYSLLGLPRYVLESALILGGTLAVASTVLFSNVLDQSTTAAIFLAAGLRLLALLIPLQASVNQMTDGMQRGSEALVSLRNRPNTNGRGQSRTSIRGEFEFRGPLSLHIENLSFKFLEKSPVLESVSLSAQPGEHIAIVGPSGSGKTTLFRLALGQLSGSGSVRIGGEYPGELVSNRPGLIGYVPQDPKILHGTLAENVSLLPPDETDLNKVKECLTDAGLQDMANSSLTNILSPENTNLSGGEIQRLGIARALYGDPGIIFLDEATSALDGETENEIGKTLRDYVGKITVVTIAHRLSSIRSADNIFFLEKGRVIASGSFDYLQRTSPEFQKAIQNLDLGGSPGSH